MQLYQLMPLLVHALLFGRLLRRRRPAGRAALRLKLLLAAARECAVGALRSGCRYQASVAGGMQDVGSQSEGNGPRPSGRRPITAGARAGSGRAREELALAAQRPDQPDRLLRADRRSPAGGAEPAGGDRPHLGRRRGLGARGDRPGDSLVRRVCGALLARLRRDRPAPGGAPVALGARRQLGGVRKRPGGHRARRVGAEEPRLLDGDGRPAIGPAVRPGQLGQRGRGRGDRGPDVARGDPRIHEPAAHAASRPLRGSP